MVEEVVEDVVRARHQSGSFFCTSDDIGAEFKVSDGYMES